MPTVAETAWCAGLFDGEGCIYIARYEPKAARAVSTRYVLNVKITMCDAPTIRRVHEILRVGSVSTTHHNPHRTSRAWSWVATTRAAVSVLKLLRPFLVTKAAEADIAQRFAALPRAPGGGRLVPTSLMKQRQKLFEEMRDVKPRAKLRARLLHRV